MKYPKSENHKNNIGIGHQKPILQYDLEGNFIKEWPSINNASFILNLNKTAISKCCRKIIKQSGKFKWEFKNII
jgi:hypothetical protein